MRVALIPAVLLTLMAQSACTPSLNWRELSPPDSGITLSFPCRPAFVERPASVDGPAMGMAHCETGGMVFSVSWADVPEAAAVPLALRELPRSVVYRLGTSTGPTSSVSVPGSTPQPDAGQYAIRAGRAWVRVACFAKGLRVYQLLLQSDRESAATWQSFLDGVTLKPR